MTESLLFIPAFFVVYTDFSPVSYEKQIQMSGFPIKKTLDDFDFSFQPSIDKRQIDELATMRFLENAENVNGAPARAQRSGSRGERRKE